MKDDYKILLNENEILSKRISNFHNENSFNENNNHLKRENFELKNEIKNKNIEILKFEFI